MICNNDCFNCKYDDCIRTCTHYDLYKETYDNYAKSEKGKAAHRRYYNSEKGKLNEKNKRNKKIKTGKNAEYCRNYYKKHRADILAKKREARLNGETAVAV